MISTQKLLNCLNEIKEITKLDLALFHDNGKVAAATMSVDARLESIVSEFATSEAEQQTYMDYLFYKINIENDMEYILVTEGVVENAFVIGQMAVCQIRNLIISKAEAYDRNNFIQNVLLGNLLTVDLYGRAKRLHIEAKPRVTYVIDTGNKSTDMVMELVKNLSDLKAGDFVTSVDEHSVVLVKDVSYIEEDDMDEENY